MSSVHELSSEKTKNKNCLLLIFRSKSIVIKNSLLQKGYLILFACSLALAFTGQFKSQTLRIGGALKIGLFMNYGLYQINNYSNRLMNSVQKINNYQKIRRLKELKCFHSIHFIQQYFNYLAKNCSVWNSQYVLPCIS